MNDCKPANVIQANAWKHLYNTVEHHAMCYVIITVLCANFLPPLKPWWLNCLFSCPFPATREVYCVNTRWEHEGGGQETSASHAGLKLGFPQSCKLQKWSHDQKIWWRVDQSAGLNHLRFLLCCGKVMEILCKGNVQEMAECLQQKKSERLKPTTFHAWIKVAPQ